LASRDPTNRQLQRDLSIAYAKIGLLLIRIGSWDEAIRQEEKALAIAEELIRSDPNNPEYRELLADSYLDLGKATYPRSDVASLEARRFALAKFKQSAAIHEQLLAEHPEDARRQKNFALSLCYISYAYWRIGDLTHDLTNYEAALPPEEKARELFAAVATAAPLDTDAQRHTGTILDDIGHTHLLLHEIQSARDDYARAFVIFDKLAAADPSNTEAQRDLADVQDGLAETSRQLGDMAAAVAKKRAANTLFANLFASHPEDIETANVLLTSYDSLGELLAQEHDPAGALQNIEKALRVAEKLNEKGGTAPDLLDLIRRMRARIAQLQAEVTAIAKAPLGRP
jgi:tetratricopeptide (TPR) repeat protein